MCFFKMKKNITFLFFLFYVLTCCNKQIEDEHNSNKNDTIIVYNEVDYYKFKTKKIKIIDTVCLFEEKMAKNDIKKGKLKYFLHYGVAQYDFSNKEMSNLLLKYSITLDTILTTCVMAPKGFRRYCYSKLMNLEINRRFGENFIDSLRVISDRQFIENNPNFIFSFSDCDLTSRYEKANNYDEFLEKPEDDFVTGLKHPKMNRKQLRKEKANTEVYFVIYKNGKIGNIYAETNFEISRNIEFAKFFEKEAITFVKKSQWKPAEYRGIKVNSELSINFYNK